MLVKSSKNIKKTMLQPKFPKPESVGEREWGTEELLVLVSGKYSLKKIYLKAGSKGGLQFHRQKNECGIVISGAMKVIFDNGNGDLDEKIVGVGDVFHFEPGVVHQTEAISDTTYIEASTPHFNDRVHVESLYGLDIEAGGLPTTSASEIELR
jgi:mannose-6-phosphate isomerase-like protein (cupin superfamily)